MIYEIRRLYRTAIARQVARAGTNNSPEIDDLAGNERRIVQCSQSQRNVYVFADDVDNSVGDQKIEGNFGIARQKIPQHRREMMSGNERKSMHAQMSSRGTARRGNLRFSGLDGSKNVAHTFKIDFPLGGQCQTSGRPVDEASAKASL